MVAIGHVAIHQDAEVSGVGNQEEGFGAICLDGDRAVRASLKILHFGLPLSTLVRFSYSNRARALG